MKYVLDLHTHTLASGHAYNTIREMAQSAAEKGIEMLGITEHAMAMPGSSHSFYFENLKMLERSMYGVEMLFGVELNIIDTQGTVDMEDKILRKLDVSVASMHTICMTPGSREENTHAYLKAMENPYINIIGHPDDGRFPVDYLALVQGAKEYNTLLEVNNNSLDPRCFRENGEENITTMLGHCKEYHVPVIINSDAHTDDLVGCHGFAETLIKNIGFPEELVVNRSVQEAKRYINRYKDR